MKINHILFYSILVYIIIFYSIQVQELENINSQLRLNLASYNDASKLMVDSAELDGLSKPEVLSRYGESRPDR